LFLGDTGVHVVDSIMCTDRVPCDYVKRDRCFEGEEERLGIGIDMEWARHDRDALYALVLEMCVDKVRRCVANGL
jgi:hypothetical protein